MSLSEKQIQATKKYPHDKIPNNEWETGPNADVVELHVSTEVYLLKLRALQKKKQYLSMTGVRGG